MCLTPHKLPYKLLPEKYWQTVPCGKCPECYTRRAQDWGTRAQHEMSLYPNNNAFITLSYDNAQLKNCSFDYTDFQKFIKRLRKKHDIRYMTSLEYGGKHGRLHFHSILFNYYPIRIDPRTQEEVPLKKLKISPSGYQLFRSDEIEKLWPYGYSSVAPANIETAYYIAKYALSDSTYVNSDGEILSDRLFTSKNPAIGLTYFKIHYKSLIAKSIFEGFSMPRYYIKMLEKFFPQDFIYYKTEMAKIAISDNKDEYARLCEIIAKQNTTDFREKKNLNHLKIQLSEFEQRKYLSERAIKRI